MAATLHSSDVLAPALFPAATTWFSSSVALLVSLIVHTTLLIVFALISWGSTPTPDPQGHGPLAEVEIGTLSVERLSVQPAEWLEASDAPGGVDAHDAFDATIEVLADLRGPVASEFAVEELVSPLAASGANQTAKIGELGTVASMGAGKIDGQATFMGVQAQGDRFCIVADRSGSMFGSKFEFLKAEILRTVSSMSPHARLQLVLFNERALPYPKEEWLQPGRERLAIETWLRGVVADGDTYPRGALNHAFAFDPPPNAIFFMTDGQFDPQTVYQLRRLQRVASHRVKIHTITFVDRSSEGMMRLIAAENGGTYRHVSEIDD